MRHWTYLSLILCFTLIITSGCTSQKASMASSRSRPAKTATGSGKTVTAGGYKWTNYRIGLNEQGISFAFDKNGRAFVDFWKDGLFSSDDSGKHWTKAKTGIDAQYFWCVASDQSGRFYLGTSRGLYISDDGGASWQHSGSGMKEAPEKIAVGPDGKVYVMAYGDSTLYCSDNKGKSWKRICGNWKESSMGETIAVNSHGDVYTPLDSGIGVCRKGSGKWSILPVGKMKGYVETVIVDKQDRILAGVITPNPDTFKYPINLPKQEAPILRSTDGGKHWDRINPFPLESYGDHSFCNSFCIGPTGEIIAGTSHGVIVSNDGGSNWKFALHTRDINNPKGSNPPGCVGLVGADSNGRIIAVDSGCSDICLGVPIGH